MDIGTGGGGGVEGGGRALSRIIAAFLSIIAAVLLTQSCTVPSQLCNLDADTLAKQMKDIPHRYDVSGVGLIKLAINIRY